MRGLHSAGATPYVSRPLSRNHPHHTNSGSPLTSQRDIHEQNKAQAKPVERTKPSAFIQTQSVDGAFLTSASRCPTSRLAERLEEKRKAAMPVNKHRHAPCTVKSGRLQAKGKTQANVSTLRDPRHPHGQYKRIRKQESYKIDNCATCPGTGKLSKYCGAILPLGYVLYMT